jgi:hypothetical protein
MEAIAAVRQQVEDCDGGSDGEKRGIVRTA